MGDRFVLPLQSALGTIAEPLLAGAKLYFYETGTSTPLATYSDRALTVANTNPVVADADGRFTDIFLQGQDYKAVLDDANDVTIWTADPVGLNDAVNVRYSPADSGATDRTVQSALRDKLHIFDIIPPAQHSAIELGTSTYDASADLATFFAKCIAERRPGHFRGNGSIIRLATTGGIQMMAAGDKYLHIVGNGQIFEQAGSSTVWTTEDLSSAPTGEFALTSDIAAEDSTVGLPTGQGANFSEGDIFIVQSDELQIGGSGTPLHRAREMRMVVAISGDTLSLEAPLRFRYRVSDSAKAANYSLVMCEGLFIEDVIWQTANGTETGRPMRVDNCRHVVVKNWWSRNAGGGIQFADCYGIWIDGYENYLPTTRGQAGVGYGLNINGSSRFADVYGLRGTEVGHHVTSNPRVRDTFEYGEPELVTLYAPKTTNFTTTHTPDLDTHEQGWAWQVIGAKVTRQIGAGGNGGMKTRSTDTVWRGCEVEGGNRPFETVEVSKNARLYDCISRNASTVAFQLNSQPGFPPEAYNCRAYDPVQRGTSPSTDGVILEDFYCKNPVLQAIRDQSAQGIKVRRAIMEKGADSTATPINGLAGGTEAVYDGLDFVGYDYTDIDNSNDWLFTNTKWNGAPIEGVRFDFTADFNFRAPLIAGMHGNAGASGTVTGSLPPALTGMRITLIRDAAFAFRADPDGTETVGTGGAGKYIELTAAGVTHLICRSDGHWDVDTESGTVAYEP